MDNQTAQTPNPLPPVMPPPAPVIPPAQPGKKGVNIWLLLIPVVLISFISTVYFLIPKQKTAVTGPVIPTPIISTTVPSPTGTANWLTYDGEDYSYKYPPTWTNGEEGKSFFNLESPDFTKKPFKGSIIVIETQPIAVDEEITTIAKKFDDNKTPYKWVTVDSQSGIQYDEIITAETPEVTPGQTPETEYRTVTVYYNVFRKIQLVYEYEKDHKNDSLNIYTGFLSTFIMKPLE